MKRILLACFCLFAAAAPATPPLAPRGKPVPTPTTSQGALNRMDRILLAMRQATARGIAQADAAVADLNTRIDALSQQVKTMIDQVQRASTAPDVEMRETVKGDVRNLSGIVQKLDVETFRKVQQQTQELMKEADSIQ